ncbi:neutral amino acid transporter [Apophysomyces ossiformis]|uniref:Neutral amino acid transporter n=1 Tax=Apophysomyces ossiformis TaxID=679940 RepID=A0A8H7ENF0_9FUNG|nr:neutral amino acid transporter [Apophysomyces ossiformis]
MERSWTIDLPVEQVAKVVKRHLVFQPTQSYGSSSSSHVPIPPSRRQQHHHKKDERRHEFPTYSTHHVLPGGSVLDEIYKWTAQVEHTQQRRQRSQSISLPAVREVVKDPLLQSLKQPGGFRRYHVLTKAARQGKQPNFVTSSFVEFLCLYGHFGGEDLSDDDETSSDDEYSSSDEEIDSDEAEQEGSVMAYRGQMFNNTQYMTTNHSNSHKNGKTPELPSAQESDTSLPGLPLPATSDSRKSASTSGYKSFPALNGHHQPVQYRHLHARETMPLLSRSRPGQTLQGKATPGKAMFLLLKSFVTTGIMFLPKAFYNGGLLFSMVAITMWAWISLWSFLLLVQTRLVVPASFGDMGGVLYGSKMRMAVLVAITLSQIGFVCAYMVFVAENLQSLVLTFSRCRVLIPMHLLILAQSFAFIPLAMIRKIHRLSVFALIADVFIVIGLAYLFYYDFKELFTVGMANVAMWNPSHFPLFVGTAAFTYEGIGLVIPITESMKEPQKFPTVLRRAIFFITLLFISMGAISYLAFGEDVQTIILLNLPSNDPVVSSIQTLYSLAICLSIPLQLFPAIRIMENGLFTTRSGKNNAVVKWQKNVFRVLIVFLCAWIAIVGSKDKLDKFVSLIGALFCIPLCFIFPPLFHLRALSLPSARRLANYALITFGILCMFGIAYATLSQWNSAAVLDPVKQCITRRTLFALLGSIFTLFAFLLQLFVLIGQLSNRAFLRDLYFAQVMQPSQDRVYNFNLWNYCTGNLAGQVQSCSKPRPAYNWAQTPGINQALSGQANSSVVSGIFLALFILYFISTGLSLIFWFISCPTCCVGRRGLGVSMSTLLFINFLILLVCLILALVVSLRGIRLLTGADSSWLGHAGNSMWITIGGVVSLFLAFLFYSLASCCYRPRPRRQIEPDYKGGHESMRSPYVPPAHPFYDQQQQQQQGRLFQQPYTHPDSAGAQYTPAMQHQQWPQGGYETQPQQEGATYQTPVGAGQDGQAPEANRQQTV